jgi:GNAT superfamily N-acetyltransferase
MITKLESAAILRSGERMAVKVIQPYEAEYAGKLCRFLKHKGGNEFRGIRQRLEGKYVEYCIDKYFVGEVRDQVVGQAWYGLPKDGSGVGNFGHVYTAPRHRHRGIATELVGILAADFLQDDGKCLLCSAEEMAGRIYHKFGFNFIREGAMSGPMALIKEEVAGSFQELAQWYFEGGCDVEIREGTIRDRHDCDRMLDFARKMGDPRDWWRAVSIANEVPTYIDALFHVEDGEGILAVLQGSMGRILGYGFVLDLNYGPVGNLKTMDFMIHPNYLDRVREFIKETVAIADAAGITEIHALPLIGDRDKVAALMKAGFREVCTITSKLREDGRYREVVALRLGRRGSIAAAPPEPELAPV